jgi:hypothetical protein
LPPHAALLTFASLRAIKSAFPPHPATPQVLLTAQHAQYYDRAALRDTRASDHSSDKQLTERVWRDAVQAAAGRAYSSVLVVTAASFLNLLNRGVASIDGQVDLLVGDLAWSRACFLVSLPAPRVLTCS